MKTIQQRSVDAAVQQACALAAQVLRACPSALITDLDGTLSPIVFAPEEASVLPRCRRALQRPRGQVDLMAVGVVGPESPPEVADRADVVLAGPEQVEVFLEELVKALG